MKILLKCLLILFIGYLIVYTQSAKLPVKISDVNDIKNRLDTFKKSIVRIMSRTDTPFISEVGEVISVNGFIIDYKNLLILTTKKAARMSPSSVKVQFYDGKIVNGRVLYSGRL